MNLRCVVGRRQKVGIVRTLSLVCRRIEIVLPLPVTRAYSVDTSICWKEADCNLRMLNRAALREHISQ